MKKNIYYEKSCKNEIDNYDQITFERKYKLINYLLITQKNDMVFELLQRVDAQKLSAKESKKFDYLKFIYFINEDNEYNINAMKHKLIKANPKEKWFYELISEKDINKKNDMFINISKSKYIILKFMNKKYRTQLTYMYLLGFAINDNPIRIKCIEKYINNRIKKLNKKKDLSITDINYIKIICIGGLNRLAYIYLKNTSCFVDLAEIYKLIVKTIKIKKTYKDFSQNEKKEFNSHIFYALQSIINLSNSLNEDNQEMIDFTNKFIDENIDCIDDNIRILRKVNDTNFIECLEDVLRNNNSKIDITEYMLLYASSKYDNLEDAYAEICKIYEKYETNMSDILKTRMNLGLQLINLWANGRFDKDKINGEFRVSEFIKIVIEFFNGNISKKDFVEKIKLLKSIDCYQILNWYKIEEKMQGGNLDWLVLILDKIDTEPDFKMMEYLGNLYKEILENNKSMFIHSFKSINQLILKKFDNMFFLVNSIKIFFYIYRDFEEVRKLMPLVIKNWDGSKLQNEEKLFLEIVFMIVEKEINTIEWKNIEEIIEKIEIKINKDFIYFYLQLIYRDIIITEEMYQRIVKYIINIYKDRENIDDDIYKIITSIANKIMIKNIELKCQEYDVVYVKDNKIYFLENTDKELQNYYQSIDMNKIENIDSNYEKDNISNILLHKIFFEKMEEKGIGQMIKIPIDANAKTILEEINKAIGYDKVLDQKNKIRNGNKIDTLLLNIYDLNSIMEDIISKKWKIFNNSKNNRFLSEKKIMHLTSIILLSQIDMLKILEENECYVSNEIYNNISKICNNEINILGRGILEEAFFYDDELEKIFGILQKLKKNSRIFNVTKANLLPKENINEYDGEIVKYVVENMQTQNDICIITEDSFYLENFPFNEMSEGTVSLLIDSYIKNIITPKELYESISKLNDMQYNLNIGNTLFTYLLAKADDEYIKDTISIINRYKINQKNIGKAN